MKSGRLRTSTTRGALIACLVLIMIPVVCAGSDATAEVSELSPGEVMALISRNEDIQLINTMSTIECLDHTISGAICIPCPVFDRMAPELLPRKDQLLVFFCESPSCHRSEHAAEKASLLGYTNIAILKGGLPEWKHAGYDVESKRRIPRRGIESIKPKRLDSWLDEHKNVLIVDLRSEDLYADNHLPGAVNIPMDVLHERYLELPMDRMLLVVDERGYRSFLGACYLSWKGYVDVKRLFGGMENWKAANVKKR
ncbi:MAG: rhodanese-like domain-containing protein [Desulfomonilia bacterium]